MAAIDTFMDARDLHVLILMFKSQSPEFRRELAVVTLPSLRFAYMGCDVMSCKC